MVFCLKQHTFHILFANRVAQRCLVEYGPTQTVSLTMEQLTSGGSLALISDSSLNIFMIMGTGPRHLEKSVPAGKKTKYPGITFSKPTMRKAISIMFLHGGLIQARRRLQARWAA